MARLRISTIALSVVGCLAFYGLAGAASTKTETEPYVSEPMPQGFQVVNTPLDGAVFANANGRTLYTWPSLTQRNGSYGDSGGKSYCNDTHYRETAGISIPYPAGLELPNADHRPTCIQYWPPVIAGADAKPVGNFTIIDRADGSKQWAYKDLPLYTSHLDHQPGEANGGSSRRLGKDSTSGGAPRKPAKPAAQVPPKFDVTTMLLGRMLVSDTGWSIYSYDKDTAKTSNCTGVCTADFDPMLAPDTAIPVGDWSVIERPGGRKQWAFRGKPLYRYFKDMKERAQDGSDQPGWHNVFLQRSASPPKGFHSVATDGGEVLTTPQGKTVYFYSCSEDTPDQLRCDDTNSPQEYRLAVCGAGDPERCLQTFPYIIADKDAKSDNLAWTIRDIDPKTGRYVAAGTPGSLHIWAFRDRPIYTFAGDKQPGDIVADVWGEAFGQKNGFSALWTRDLFVGNEGGQD